MGVYDDIDKKTALDIINSLVNTEGAEIGITLSKEFLKSLLSALNDDEQNGCVKWYQYPQEKPNKYGKFAVWLKNGNTFHEARYNAVDDVFWLNGIEALDAEDVTHWAELSKPYGDKKE